MTLNFAAALFSKSDELLRDLQNKVSSGKVGALIVDSAHILNLEPEVCKIITQCKWIYERSYIWTSEKDMIVWLIIAVINTT